MLDNLREESLLFDFYGALLAEKQREFFRLYHEENCSLQEIAEEYGLSRQGVYDAVSKAEQALRSYEEKLGLMERFLKEEKVLKTARSALEELRLEYAGCGELGSRLGKIEAMLEDLEE